MAAASRRFRVTEVGQTFYDRCRAMMLEAERAEALVAEAQADPHGRIRMSCPRNLVKSVSAMVRDFLDRYPKVQLQLVASDRAVDLLEERIDVALRVRHELTSDSVAHHAVPSDAPAGSSSPARRSQASSAPTSPPSRRWVRATRRRD